jgi:hypothetical protein
MWVPRKHPLPELLARQVPCLFVVASKEVTLENSPSIGIIVKY